MPILIPLPWPAARAVRAAVRAGALTGAAALLAATAGCAGSPGQGNSQVATLPSAAATTAWAAATGGPAGSQPTGAGSGQASLQGPTIPNGASQAEVTHLMQPWNQCLQAHGVKLPQHIGTPGNGSAGEAACQSLEPHPPWQEMPAYNPHYNQDLAAWVNCLNAHGVHAHVVPNGWAADNGAPLPPSDNQLVLSCEAQAFHVG